MSSKGQAFKAWQQVNDSLGMATFAEDAGSGSWEAWADGGRMYWCGVYLRDPNQNFDWFVVTGSDGRQADESELAAAIRQLVNPLPPEPEPEPEPEPIDWDRVAIETYRRQCNLWR